MFQLFNFFLNNKTGLLFIFLEVMAFVFVLNSHSYHQSKILNSANIVSGAILKKSNAINDYFSLKNKNKTLAIENEQLKNKLEQLSNKNAAVHKPLVQYEHIAATVISNPYTKTNNVLTLNKGSLDSVQPNMGVVLSNGIVGIILNVSKHYATVLSLLNSQSKINAKMKNSHHYGSLYWNGQDYTKVNLEDLPIQANIKIGDTIISGGKSILFPEGIPIGSISKFHIDNKSYSEVSVDLFADYSALHNVYVVKNQRKKEQLELEQKSIHE